MRLEISSEIQSIDKREFDEFMLGSRAILGEKFHTAYDERKPPYSSDDSELLYDMLK